MTNAIEISGLKRYFGSVKAVDGIDLSIPQGELFCFLGPNGAGKTTTIRMLTGLIRPTAGQIRICGVDIHKEPVRAKQQIGYIPDSPYLYDRLTPLEFMQFTADVYGIPEKEAIPSGLALLEMFRLTAQTRSLIKDLSHGMRQRLIYAATLLHQPKVLFIDEPLIGLDPHTISMIKELLVKKARGGMTIFLTTHILPLAEAIADRIAIIQDGRILSLGTLTELRAASGREKGLEQIFLELTEAEGAEEISS
jgi:ABC-2 type transport system ATP-binding protein